MLRRPRTARREGGRRRGASAGSRSSSARRSLVLVERSLAVGDGYGLDAYRALVEPTSVLLATPWEAVANSLVYAAAATALALVVGGLAAFAIAEPGGGTRRACCSTRCSCSRSAPPP